MTKKEKWVHLLNQKVEALSNKSLSQTIRENANKSRSDIFNKIEEKGSITSKEINTIIKKNSIDKKIIEKVALNNFITSQVNLLFLQRQIVGLKYGNIVKTIISKSPITTAKHINLISTNIIKGSETISNVKLQVGYVRLKDIVSKKEFTQIKQVVRQYREQYDLYARDSIKRELKRTVKTLKDNGLNLKDLNTNVAKDVDNKKFVSAIKKKFVNKSDKQIKNISGNMIHRELEDNKLVNAKDSGFKYKIWVTQGDDRVRPTHKAVNNTKIPINEMFTVGGSSGLYPQDQKNFDIKEWINCRCYLKYE